MCAAKALEDMHRADHQRSLFPLETNRIIVSSAQSRLDEFIEETSDDHGLIDVGPQIPVYCEKRGRHLRRTFKLDPVADYFFYRLVYKNRTHFRKGRSQTRRTFGYVFTRGEVLSPRAAYRDFRETVRGARSEFDFSVKMDVAAYFPSLYHHDLVNWFEAVTGGEGDHLQLGAFLRKINSGRSIDCLPQGIVPAKVLGSRFLEFVDRSRKLKSSLMLRFMDDIYLFSDSRESILADFFRIQELLSAKGLCLNAAKTEFDLERDIEIDLEVDEVRQSLVERELDFATASGECADEWEPEYEEVLSEEQVEYLLHLLKTGDLEDEEAELVLNLMRDHGEDVLEYFDTFLSEFPHLSKSVFHFCRWVLDRSSLASAINGFLRRNELLSDFQLFWLGRTVLAYLQDTRKYGDLLIRILEHKSASAIVQAKILESTEQDFGIAEAQDEHLRSGESGWLAWASAIGIRNRPPAARNQALKYFERASQINRLIGGVVRSLPAEG